MQFTPSSIIPYFIDYQNVQRYVRLHENEWRMVWNWLIYKQIVVCFFNKAKSILRQLIGYKGLEIKLCYWVSFTYTRMFVDCLCSLLAMVSKLPPSSTLAYQAFILLLMFTFCHSRSSFSIFSFSHSPHLFYFTQF